MTPVRATLRLQFHAGFTLDDAAAIVPYAQQLGISHLYASPILKARAGSTHGYDIVDHAAINPELGGEPALLRLHAALRAHGMGLILDIVPNHMGVGGADNLWWMDVLEWGRISEYAGFFDIDWEPPDRALNNRILAPFLGAPYGEALANGDIELRLDAENGTLAAWYFEHRFPIAPQHYGHILRAAGEASLEPLVQSFGLVDMHRRNRYLAGAASQEAKRALAAVAATAAGAAALAKALAAFDPKEEAGRQRLHKLLERQHYRLAWWQAAADEINWRRFFDVNGLAGLRAERAEVFDATHALVLRLYGEGVFDGLRIDHVDGLADPRSYCRKLARRMAAARPGVEPLIWVEKILAPFESLRTDWSVAGSTGYDFMDEVAGVLHDPAGEAPLTALWAETTGRPARFEDEAREARRQIVRENLAAEWNSTAAAIKRLAARDLTTRDFSLTAIRRALSEVLVHFPVYRLYISPAGRGAEDKRLLDWALAGARRTVRAKERPLLELLDAWLGGDPPRSLPPALRRESLAAAVRFQQLSSPVAAKSVEDTAFYRYGRLLSRNEVGSDPARFAVTPQAFHATARARQKYFPQALLATATHDHKRGEDMRARLAVLSELPDDWTTALQRWTRLNASLKRDVDGLPAPDAADEVMLYQTLVGAWPLDLSSQDETGVAALIERVAAWQEKAMREAKRRSEWAVPNVAYETACREFLEAALAPDRASRLRDEIAGMAERLATAGALNGLSQTLLRCTAPGIPDLYQGAEFWDFSLVDPDNRRPVDFAARAAALAITPDWPALLDRWRDGRVKQAVIARALAARERNPELFAAGDYQPIVIEGPAAGQVLAFARRHRDATCLIVTTRLGAKLLHPHAPPLLPSEAWDGTVAQLPHHGGVSGAGGWRDALTGSVIEVTTSGVPVGRILAGLPVALLEAV